jgi:hypothetical protein
MRKRRLIKRASKVLLITLIIPMLITDKNHSAEAGTLYTSNVYPIMDTYVNSGGWYLNDESLATTNKGSETMLEFGRMGNRSSYSYPYFRINLKEMEGMGNISSARLIAPYISHYLYLSYSSVSFKAFRVIGDWNETTLTYNNQPSRVDDLNTITNYSGYTAPSIDISKSLQKAIDLGLEYLDIMVMTYSGPTDNSWAGLQTGSRENSDISKKAYIQVQYDNMKPKLTLNPSSENIFSAQPSNDVMKIEGTVSDSDIDNHLNIYYSIDGKPPVELASTIQGDKSN